MKALNNSELIFFCIQLALTLRSGISALEGLSLMLEDTPEGDGRKLLEQVIHELEQTGSLSRALEAAEAFPAYLCSMTELGEQAGRLDDVMEALAAHYRREESLSRNLRSAVAYPLVMLGMMIAVMAVLLVKVMPVFRQVYEQLGAQMTGFPGAVLKLGGALGNYSAVFLVLAFLAAAACVFLFFTEKGRQLSGSLFNRSIFTRRLAEKTACSRFAAAMHLSLNSGLDVDQSLEMTEQLVEHPKVRAQIQDIRRSVASGEETFAEAVARTRIFTGAFARMLAAGFRAGSLDEVMKQISLQYEDEIEEQIDRILGRLEPTLVAVLSVAVGLILLSVMLPLLGIMINIGG